MSETGKLMSVDQRRLVLPSESYPNSNYFEVTYTCRIPTTCEVDSLDARTHIERNPKTWISYLEKAESKFVGQNAESIRAEIKL